MSNNKSKPVSAAAFDLDLCFLSGAKFCESAGRFFQQLPAGLEEAARFAADQRGDLIVATTNLALGVELLLKALAISRSREVLTTHRLIDLFDALPPDYRSSIESLFKKEIAGVDRNRATALVVLLSPRGSPPEKSDGTERPDQSSIRSVLEGEKDAFRTWRYVHESGNPTGTKRIWCQYTSLLTVASVLLWHFLLDPMNGRVLKTRRYGA